MERLRRVWLASRERLPFRTPGSVPPFWDLLMLQLLRPNSSNLPCLYSTFHLEYPLVLSRFYLIIYSFMCDKIENCIGNMSSFLNIYYYKVSTILISLYHTNENVLVYFDSDLKIIRKGIFFLIFEKFNVYTTSILRKFAFVHEEKVNII